MVLNKKKVEGMILVGGISTISGIIGAGIASMVLKRNIKKNNKTVQKIKDEVIETLDKYKSDFDLYCDQLTTANSRVMESIDEAEAIRRKLLDTEIEISNNIGAAIKESAATCIKEINEHQQTIIENIDKHLKE